MPRLPDAPPARRPLKVYAFDPMRGRSPKMRITVDVPNEVGLLPGPVGERIAVVDYDGAMGTSYEPVDLNEPNILMQGGLDPNSSDPRFHQQMVYAISMKVLENFDVALGRRLKFRGNRPLQLFPHAFQGANAYFDPKLNALLFGYFRADQRKPGENLPRQTIFTCLSADIIAHELTHALVDRLRPRFRYPTNQDVAAFHEAFADLVAIFQHFTFSDILEEVIQDIRTDLRDHSPLIELAAQFGHARGKDEALRMAVSAPDPSKYEKTIEPHQRGSILVAAVFEAFLATYERRTADLIRIATNGSGHLNAGRLQKDLAARIAREAQKTAQMMLTVCIRAFDYLPPVDVTFGDYLRALVTADFELVPTDELSVRASLIEAFRRRGIYPDGVTSLAEESLVWERNPTIEKVPGKLLQKLVVAAQGLLQKTDSRKEQTAAGTSDEDGLTKDDIRTLHAYATKKENRERLGLQSGFPVGVGAFHCSFRVGRDGMSRPELIAQFVQQDQSSKAALGGVAFWGGVTLVAGADGTVRYLVKKPMSEGRRAAQLRFVELLDARDSAMPFADAHYTKKRMALRMRFSDLHEGRS